MGLCLLTMTIITLIFSQIFTKVLNGEYENLRIIIYIAAVLLPILFFKIPQLLFGKSFIGKMILKRY